MIGVALLIALAAPRDGLPPGAGEPRTGRCHMGECSWFAELGRATIREEKGGRLLRLALLGGTSVSDEGEEYEEPWGPDARVDWDRAPHDVWVLCSPSLPAVMVRSAEGAVQADVLNFVDGIPPVLESSRSVYVHACHGEESEDMALRHGYVAPEIEEIDLARPEDIFGRLR